MIIIGDGEKAFAGTTTDENKLPEGKFGVARKSILWDGKTWGRARRVPGRKESIECGQKNTVPWPEESQQTGPSSPHFFLIMNRSKFPLSNGI